MKISRAILGIDAAWTENNPAGVALVCETDSRWECIAAAPSYKDFLAFAEGKKISWSNTQKGTAPAADELIAAARKLCGRDIDLVSADIPLATIPISGRRSADRAISKTFGKNWCSTHTPSSKRPGIIGQTLLNGFNGLGYVLATTVINPKIRVLIECYPHPALLVLCNRERRLKYKVSKARTTERQIIVAEMQAIINSLSRYISDIDKFIDPIPQDGTLSQLKRWEDAADALVAAWVGIEYLNSRVDCYGDETAAIWVPRKSPDA